MPINIKTLTSKDIGREVLFRYSHGEIVYGHLSSWNEVNLFVKFKGPTGEACYPSWCDFCHPTPEEKEFSEKTEGLK